MQPLGSVDLWPKDGPLLRLDVIQRERANTPGINICQPLSNIRPQRNQACKLHVLESLEKAQCLPHDFTGGTVQTGGDLLTDPVLEFGWQGHVEGHD